MSVMFLPSRPLRGLGYGRSAPVPVRAVRRATVKVAESLVAASSAPKTAVTMIREDAAPTTTPLTPTPPPVTPALPAVTAPPPTPETPAPAAVTPTGDIVVPDSTLPADSRPPALVAEKDNKPLIIGASLAVLAAIGFWAWKRNR